MSMPQHEFPTTIPASLFRSRFNRSHWNRRSIETIALSVIAIATVGYLRYRIESPGLFFAEMGTVLVLATVAVLLRRLTPPLCYLLGLMPAIYAVLSRQIGSPIAHEMAALSTLGAISLAIAVAGTASRPRAMSVVASGFLVLFTTSISDNQNAVAFAVLWMTVCVWHLVANHWERLDLCMPENVRRSVGVRPLSVVIAVGLCMIGSLLVRDRFGDANRFTFGFMPTSGGSQWSDPAAQSGVGSGDAVIAAKDHAESFGAVESDLFLESTESTLFDMFSDSIGEPKLKPKWERRQGMSPESTIEAHEQMAKSEKGGSSFSTDRLPPKKHLHLSDSLERAVVQWDGPTGIRLGMNRYDTFDGVHWTNQHGSQDRDTIAAGSVSRCVLDDRVWFFDPRLQQQALSADTVSVSLLKVLRLQSPRLPVPMMTAGLHIKDLDREDFLGIAPDGSLFMPGREKVPSLTVVNVASLRLSEDELCDQLQANPVGAAHNDRRRQYADNWTTECRTPYEKLRAIVDHLRTEFTFDRQTPTESSDPLGEFLRQRRGGDHLFATAAALIAREVGLESRLVTGFYVRPNQWDITAGHASVMPEDVHVWVEVKLDDHRWFEIEPTPGYQEPIYTPSTMLVLKRYAKAYWLHVAGVCLMIAMLFITRLVWVEWLLVLLWWSVSLLGSNVNRRLRIAMWIVQTRARLLGQPRPPGCPQRDWLMSLSGDDQATLGLVRRFCDVADRSSFGFTDSILTDAATRLTLRELVKEMKISRMSRLTHETAA